MRQNWKLEFSDPDCTHSDTCGCLLTINGISTKTHDVKWTGVSGTLSQQYREAAGYINSLDLSGTDVKPDTEVEYFKSQLKKNSTVTPIPNPFPGDRPSWPESVELSEPDPRVTQALRRADFRYLRDRFPFLGLSWQQVRDTVWSHPVYEVASLQALCLRTQSMAHWALGKTNGSRHVLASASGIWPHKLARSLLTIARDDVGDKPRDALRHLSEAQDHLYRLMKIDLEEKEVVPFSLNPLQGMYLGSSNGNNRGESKEIPPSENQPFKVKVKPKGKKIDTFEQDIAAILDFLATGKEPSIEFLQPLKVENFFSRVKPFDPEELASWREKLRVFTIPNSIYILLEKLVSRLRHLKERGHVIQIGRPWARGGADIIAECLGINKYNCFFPEIVEGDIKNFDQTVLEIFVNLYWSTMNIHLDPNSEDFPIFEKICKFLLRNMIQRITKIFASIWVIVKGGVPSGAYNTSHMDSWIMALYFCLFCVYQVHNAPENHREELEWDLFKIVRLVVYGDDHLYRKGLGIGSHYFSGKAFADYMMKHFNVVVRDLRDGIPFCSEEMHGWLVSVGASFLKHQFVLNKEKGEGQPTFLPYRESWEFLLRAVWGRITRPRDHIDVLLSILGHAYGTYASNKDAYVRLHLFYVELLEEVDDLENLEATMIARMTPDDIKKIRQIGLSPEELVSGFPTWDNLVSKNIVDRRYQDTTSLPMDLADTVDINEWFF